MYCKSVKCGGALLPPAPQHVGLKSSSEDLESSQPSRSNSHVSQLAEETMLPSSLQGRENRIQNGKQLSRSKPFTKHVKPNRLRIPRSSHHGTAPETHRLCSSFWQHMIVIAIGGSRPKIIIGSIHPQSQIGMISELLTSVWSESLKVNFCTTHNRSTLVRSVMAFCNKPCTVAVLTFGRMSSEEDRMCKFQEARLARLVQQ